MAWVLCYVTFNWFFDKKGIWPVKKAFTILSPNIPFVDQNGGELANQVISLWHNMFSINNVVMAWM